MSETGKPGLLRRLFGFVRAGQDASPEQAAPEAAPEAPPAEPKAKPAPPSEKPAKPEPVTSPAAMAKPASRAIKPEEPQTPPPAREPRPRPKPKPQAGKAPAPEPAPPPAAVAPPPAPKTVVVTAQPAPPEPAGQPGKGWFQRLRTGLSRSSGALSENITAVFTKRRLDEDTLQELEDILVQADLGLETAITITQAVRRGRYDKEISPEEVKTIMAQEIGRVLAPVEQPLAINPANRPHIILVVGVNGTGKTTTIGKLGASLRSQGGSIMLAAGDTFRAAAVEQLRIWGERIGAPVIARAHGADSSGLAYDAVREARQAGCDVLIIDTAGRLQNKADLMAELEKMIRVIKKHDETAPHSVLLTLDATTGQNAMQQVEIFRNVAGVTGLVMTKLDGTARGGILVAIAARYGLPVHAIGVGENLEDLQPFDAAAFARAIAGLNETEPVHEAMDS